MAKVVLVDNFDRETVADILLKDDITDSEASQLADEYNASHGSNWSYFARAVNDDYRLWRGMEELM